MRIDPSQIGCFTKYVHMTYVFTYSQLMYIPIKFMIDYHVLEKTLDSSQGSPLLFRK